MKVTNLVVAMAATLPGLGFATVVDNNQAPVQPAPVVAVVASEDGLDRNHYVSAYIENKQIDYDYDVTEDYGNNNKQSYSQNTNATVQLLGLKYTNRRDKLIFEAWVEGSFSGDYETKVSNSGAACGSKCKTTDSRYMAIGGDLMYQLPVNFEVGGLYAGGSVFYDTYDTGDYRGGDVSINDKFKRVGVLGKLLYVAAVDNWVFDASGNLGVSSLEFTSDGRDTVVDVTESRKIESNAFTYGIEGGVSYHFTSAFSLRGYAGYTGSSGFSSSCNRTVSFLNNVTCSASDPTFTEMQIGLQGQVNPSAFFK